MTRMSNRKIILIVGVILALLIIGFGAAAYAPAADERAPDSSKDNKSANEPSKTVNDYKGELVCLPHKGNPDITTLECATGFKDADGQFYSLRDDSNTLADYMTIPTGTKVVVTGTFQAGPDDVYESVGTITVSSVKKQE